MELAAESLWVRLDPGTVVQVDPTKARVEQEIEATGEGGTSDCQLFGSSGDAIWLCSPYGGHIERISTSASEVTDDLSLPFLPHARTLASGQRPALADCPLG